MSTSTTPRLNEEFVPPANPDDLKTLWNMGVAAKELMELHGTNDISQIRGADGTPLYTDFFWRIVRQDASAYCINFRGTKLFQAIQFTRAGELALPGMENGNPSDAIFRAFTAVPMKVMPPNVELDAPPFDMKELIQLIEEEKGSKF
jgi:hypothetical protein